MVAPNLPSIQKVDDRPRWCAFSFSKAHTHTDDEYDPNRLSVSRRCESTETTYILRDDRRLFALANDEIAVAIVRTCVCMCAYYPIL